MTLSNTTLTMQKVFVSAVGQDLFLRCESGPIEQPVFLNAPIHHQRVADLHPQHAVVAFVGCLRLQIGQGLIHRGQSGPSGQPAPGPDRALSAGGGYGGSNGSRGLWRLHQYGRVPGRLSEGDQPGLYRAEGGYAIAEAVGAVGALNR